METTTKVTKKIVKQINKVKILKDFCLVDWDEQIHEIHTDVEGNLVKEDKFTINHPDKSDYPPHEDFVNSFKMLRKMVIDICGWTGEFGNFQLYNPLGVTFMGMDDDETAAVIITCNKKIERSGQLFTFNTPKTTLFNAEVYADAEQLDKACAKIRDEAFLYLDGKHAAIKQLSLEFESGEKMKMDVQQEEHQEQDND